MKPPALAQALIGAVAPLSDYEIVVGDLHEEYLRIRYLRGADVANRWYWVQTLLSIPSLLSYSRSNRSALRQVRVALITLAVLLTMLVVHVVIDTVFQMPFVSVQPLPEWAWLGVNYANVVIFGVILGWLVRSDSVRVAFFASLFLVLCFVVPAFAGHPGSQAPLAAWIKLCGTVPALCLGAGLYQAIRSRADSPN